MGLIFSFLIFLCLSHTYKVSIHFSSFYVFNLFIFIVSLSLSLSFTSWGCTLVSLVETCNFTKLMIITCIFLIYELFIYLHIYLICFVFLRGIKKKQTGYSRFVFFISCFFLLCFLFSCFTQIEIVKQL